MLNILNHNKTFKDTYHEDSEAGVVVTETEYSSGGVLLIVDSLAGVLPLGSQGVVHRALKHYLHSYSR